MAFFKSILPWILLVCRQYMYLNLGTYQSVVDSQLPLEPG
eukprot:SAG31_NODE_1719_length_7455_cov_7.529772_7_plen_40_part_00